MLEELHVSNFGLLADARLEPGRGFTVISGETGTGKTMLLGALQLLSGESARRDRVGPRSDELTVEGRFTLAAGEVVVARRVTREGRSRAYADGTMATAKRLAEVVGPHVEIVAQHDALTLTRPAGVLDMVDAALTKQGRSVLADYDRAWLELARLRSDQAEIGGDRRALERELATLRQQADEIADAALAADEDVTLAVQADRLRNAEELTAGLDAANTALAADGGAIDRVGNVLAELRRLVHVDPSLEQLHGQAAAAADALGELGAELVEVATGLDHDPGALEQVEHRIAQINDLRRKYGESIAEVVAFGESAAAGAGEMQRRLTAAETLDDDIAKAKAAVGETARRLTDVRRKRAARLVATAATHLQELGMQTPLIELELQPAEPGPRGADTPVLQFASDATLPPGPVNRIASGGELSRLVLSMRLAAGAGDLPVVAFDEIDAGVGGTTALAMGEKLARLAAGRQVLCVTHLPQVAAFADSHFVVERDGTGAVVRPLIGDDRVREIARMLSGLDETASGNVHAEELLQVAAARRRAK